tara:strand:- start:1078 stop:1299 length:222 start_codon:yes stop_codon:yes gene_type:complete
MKYNHVIFSFSIAAKGESDDELKSYAADVLESEAWEYMKMLVRSPENAEIGEEIDPAEIPDFFYDEEGSDVPL